MDESKLENKILKFKLLNVLTHPSLFIFVMLAIMIGLVKLGFLLGLSQGAVILWATILSTLIITGSFKTMIKFQIYCNKKLNEYENYVQPEHLI